MCVYLKMIHYFFILFGISCVVGQYLMLPKGANCSWDGINGQCVNVLRCLSAMNDIKNKISVPICTFEDRTPIICCTDCDLVQDTRLVIYNPLLGILMKTGTNKAKDKCLDYIHTLDYPCKNGLTPSNITKYLHPINNCTYEALSYKTGVFSVGGRNALREEFPHMALLGYGDAVDTADWLCGGTVISERFVLTAAHCVSTLRTGTVKYIALGILKRSDPINLWQIYGVKRAIPHPGYKAPSKYHDIALLETDTEILFSPQVLPACLHYNDIVDSYAYATGWGAQGHKQQLADILQSVFLRLLTEEECSELYPQHRHLTNGVDKATQICYGDTKDQAVATDTCEGDSGGPLHSRDHEMCVFTILGVTSFGRPCGAVGGAGIYTRVNHYVPWIENIAWP